MQDDHMPHSAAFLRNRHIDRAVELGQLYRGADTSLARPVRKQANVSVKIA